MNARLASSITTMMAKSDVNTGKVVGSCRLALCDWDSAYGFGEIEAWTEPVTRPAKIGDNFFTYANKPAGTVFLSTMQIFIYLTACFMS
jgi:hypothetical protein